MRRDSKHRMSFIHLARLRSPCRVWIQQQTNHVLHACKQQQTICMHAFMHACMHLNSSKRIMCCMQTAANYMHACIQTAASESCAAACKQQQTIYNYLCMNACMHPNSSERIVCCVQTAANTISAAACKQQQTICMHASKQQQTNHVLLHANSSNRHACK